MFKTQQTLFRDAGITAAAIGAGAAIAGSGANAIIAGKMNRKTRAWQEKMTHRQREWALQDWDMQNKYNSPAMQMQRLKEAGLNPHLVYGNGAAQNTGDNVRATDTGNWNPTTPQIDTRAGAIGLQAYYDAQVKDQTIENLKAQNADIVEAAKLKEAQRLKLGVDTEYNQFRSNFEQGLAEISRSLRTENLRNLRLRSDVMLQENERKWLYTSQHLAEGVERILNARLGRKMTESQIQNLNQQLKLLQADEKIKQFEIELNKKGFTKYDPVYLRSGAVLVDNIMKNLGKLPESKSPGYEYGNPDNYYPGTPKSINTWKRTW